jgi:hypothetical protein
MPVGPKAIPADPIISTTSADQVCQVGNYDFATTYFWIPGNNLWGDESYKLIFGPENICPNCVSGFTVETIHMLILFGEEDVPYQFTVTGDIEEAIWDDECWAPGPQVALSDPITFAVDTRGYYTLDIPILTPCMELGFNYGIGVNFQTAFPESQRPTWLYDNDGPTFCSSWGLWTGESAWVRLLEVLNVGDLLIWADADCCDNPVDAESRSFGDVKSLFR